MQGETRIEEGTTAGEAPPAGAATSGTSRPEAGASAASAPPEPAAAEPSLTERLKRRWFAEDDHPYVHFERAVERHLTPDTVLLEAGCGRKAEVVRRFKGRAKELIGVDLVDFVPEGFDPDVRLVHGDIGDTGLPDESVDLMISRALMEHLPAPLPVFREVRRLLKPGGRYVFLAPNLGDYTAVAAKLIPNGLHPLVVRLTEGRPEQDTFPAYFRCNTKGALAKLCRSTGLELERLEYLGQYPAYFLFNPALFSLATAYEKLISRFDALGFLRGWLLVSVRKP